MNIQLTEVLSDVIGPDRPGDRARHRGGEHDAFHFRLHRPVGSDREIHYSSPWVVWCAPKHKFARMRSVTWADLAKSDLVAPGGDHEIHLAAMMRQLPDSQRTVPEQVVDNVSTALGLASKGLCYTISPAYVEPLAQPMGLVSRRIRDPELTSRDVAVQAG